MGSYLENLVNAASRESIESGKDLADTQRATQVAKLQALLKGQVADQDIERVKKLKDSGLLQPGGSAKVGDVSVGADPYSKNIMNQQHGQAQAIKGVFDTYNHGLGKIQDSAQASMEGMDLINDPKNTGSLGQARTLMLKSMGMNRYNSDEAKAVLPPTLHGMVNDIFTKAGGDTNPLNDVQRSAVNQFFKTRLDQSSKQHESLKQGALAQHQMSPFYDPAKHEALSKSLGAPFDTALNEAKSKYQNAPATGGANLGPESNPSVVDKLKNYLKSGSDSTGDSRATASQSSPLSFEEFKKRKAAGQL